MEREFQAGSFGKERIRLPSGAVNITFEDFRGEMVDTPLILEASLGWESGHTVAAVADILLREVLGINTVFACTWGSVHAMKMLGGCENPMDAFQPCVVNGVPQRNPLAHVSVESWVTTPAEHDEMNTYNINLGMLGYYSKSGLYFDKNIAVEAFEKEKLSLEWWQGFADVPRVSEYFDTYRAVAADVAQWSNSTVFPRCKGDDSGFLALQQLNITCVDGWFFGPACATNPETCIPVILAEYDWNGLVWIQAIVQHGYRFAITWLGATHSLKYSMRTTKRFLFYCATTSALCYEKPVVKMFADTHMPVGRPDLITSLLKVVWKQLPEIDERIYELISQMNIPTSDLEALMSAYSGRIKPGQSIGASEDEFVPDIACSWLKNQLKVNTHSGVYTGSNSAKWARWIPRTCEPGWAYDKAAGACRPCMPGEYSVDGRRCNPCIPGSFANREATVSCLLCDQGTWQTATGGTDCMTCPIGTRRNAKDHGCTACEPGTFSNRAGQAECDPCSRGSWNSEFRQTDCSRCPSDLTTLHEEAASVDACVCSAQTFWPCLQRKPMTSSDEVSFYLAANESCSVGNFTTILQCTRCPSGMDCPGGQRTTQNGSWHSQPSMPVGFYVDQAQPYQAFKCNHAGDLCLGNFRTGEEQCAGSGRYGRQCHACPLGQRARPGQICTDCNSTGARFLLPFFVVLFPVALGVVYALSAGMRDRSPSWTAVLSTLCVVAVNTQLFSVIVSLSVGWSDTFRSYFDWLNIFGFQLEAVTASSCYMGNDTLGPSYLPGLLMPAIITGALMAMLAVSQLLPLASSRFSPMKLDQSINALGMVLMTMYIAVCKAVFNIFECRENPSAPYTLRSHDGFLCLGDDVMGMIPMAVSGALLYIVAFGALYIWVIARAPSAYQNDARFRLRTDFLLGSWHPQFWYWGIFFLVRNLVCSLVPSVLTDGSKQAVMMFVLCLPMLIAQARVWPWREELANKHDLIMGCSLLCTLLIALGLQAPGDNDDETWPTFLEALSTLIFIGAIVCCSVLLAHFLWVEVRVQRKQRSQRAKLGDAGAFSLSMPTLMTSDEIEAKGSMPSKSSSPHSSRGLECFDDKVLDIYKTLSAVAARDPDALFELVKQMGDEMTAVDLKKLQWGIGLVGYHVLGDVTRKPAGLALGPAASRRTISCRTSSYEATSIGEKTTVSV